MAVLRMFTSLADLTSGVPPTTEVSSYVDLTRVEYGFRPTSAQSFIVQHDEASGNDTWYHFRFATTGVGSSSFDGDLVVIQDVDNTRLGGMELLNGQIRFFVEGDTTVRSAVYSYSGSVPYLIDLHIEVDGSTSITLNAYINGAAQPTVTAANTGGKGKAAMALIGCPSTALNGAFAAYSEGVIADEDTRGWRVRELKPKGIGADKQWVGSALDVVDDDVGTGISTDVTGERMCFGLSNLEFIGGGDIINRVVIQTYAQRGESGLTNLNHYFRYADTTREDTTSFNPGVTGAWFLEEFATNPDTTAAWDPADFESLQIGVRAQT